MSGQDSVTNKMRWARNFTGFPPAKNHKDGDVTVTLCYVSIRHTSLDSGFVAEGFSRSNSHLAGLSRMHCRMRFKESSLRMTCSKYLRCHKRPAMDGQPTCLIPSMYCFVLIDLRRCTT